MKRLSMLLLTAIVVMAAGSAFAGHVENVNCLSAEYAMTSARTGATDAADIAMYNPAGTVFLPNNGLFISFTMQFVWKEFENEYAGNTYEQDKPSYVPSLSLVYRHDDWAGFFIVNPPAGTGSVDWENGSATTAQMIDKIVAGARALAAGNAASGPITIYNQSIEASSTYIGFTLGGAYKLTDWLSLSVAGRYITSKREVKASARFNADITIAPDTTTVDLASDFEYEANGYGAIFGINIRPLQNLNIGLRYETVTRMEFEYSTNRRTVSVTDGEGMATNGLGAGILADLMKLDKNGQTLRYDLPAAFSIGAEYTVLPGFIVMAAFDYFFAEQANWESEGDTEDHIGDGWEVSVGATYRLAPSLKVGGGIQYTDTGVDPAGYSAENPVLNNWTFSAGCIYTAMPNLDVTLAANYTYYLSDENSDGTVKYDKMVASVAVGIQYRVDI